MVAFPNQGTKPYDSALKTWLNVTLNDDGTLKPALTVNQPSLTGTTYGAFFQFNGVDRLVLRRGTSGGGFTDLRLIGVTGEAAIYSLIAPNGTDYADWTYDGANCELDVGLGDLNLRPLNTGDSVNIWAIAHNVMLKIGDANLSKAITLQHDSTSGNITTTAGDLVFLPAGSMTVNPTNGNNLNVFAASGQAKLRLGSSGFGQAMDAYHDGTDGQISTTGGRLLLTPATTVALADAKDIAFGTTTGTKIGTVGGASGQKIAFWGATPAVQPVMATGSGKTVDNLITMLQTMGLCRQS